MHVAQLLTALTQVIGVILLCTLCLPAAAAEGPQVRRILRNASGVLPAHAGRQLQQASGSADCGDSPSCLAACFMSGTCTGGGVHCQCQYTVLSRRAIGGWALVVPAA